MDVKIPLITGKNPSKDISFSWCQEEAIQISAFEKQFNEDKIKTEFKLLQSLTETNQHGENIIGYDMPYRDKNRYSDMLPFSHTIVKTETDQKQTTPQNYYNGNYISTIFNEKDLIIALMGPLETYQNVFWRMVWVNDVKTIVMLCQLEDSKRVQCAHYWPQKEEKYGEYTVKVEVQKLGDYFNMTDLSIIYKDQKKSLQHVWWTGWPDFGVPDFNHMKEMETIANLMIKNCEENQRTIVHCSAGVGRTGTMIACFQIQRIMQYYEKQIQSQIKEGRPKEEVLKDSSYSISIFSIVRRQREDRICLVQNKDQYRFVYEFAAMQIKKLLKQFIKK